MRTLKVAIVALALSGIFAAAASAAPQITASEDGAEFYCTKGVQNYVVCQNGATHTINFPVESGSMFAGYGTWTDMNGVDHQYERWLPESAGTVSLEVLDSNNNTLYVASPKTVMFGTWGGKVWATIVIPASATRMFPRYDTWLTFRLRASGARYEEFNLDAGLWDIAIEYNYQTTSTPCMDCQKGQYVRLPAGFMSGNLTTRMGKR